jgi:hypothetical protein
MDELNRKTVEEFKQAEKNKIIVLLDNIRSAYNVGSIFRKLHVRCRTEAAAKYLLAMQRGTTIKCAVALVLSPD